MHGQWYSCPVTSEEPSGPSTATASEVIPPVAASQHISDSPIDGGLPTASLLLPDGSTQPQPTPAAPTSARPELKPDIRSEILQHIQRADACLAKRAVDDCLVQHAATALETLDVMVDILAGDDLDIRSLLQDTRENLCDSYLAAAAERRVVAFAMLRGVMEGLFTSLYYRQQAMSLYLWAGGKTFHMVHQLLDEKHDFCVYFKALFDDDGFKQAYPNISPKHILQEARDVYDCLCRFVHKKAPAASLGPSSFEATVERVFRISLSFLEREDDLPTTLSFPTPLTFPPLLIEGSVQNKRDRKATRP